MLSATRAPPAAHTSPVTLAAALLLTWAGPLAVVAIALAGSHISERPVADFTRDMAAVAGVPPYVGMVSNLGVLLWCAAAAVALVTAAVLLRSGRRDEQVGFFLVLGTLTAALTVDDLFLVHEVVAPRFLGIPELALLLVYGATFAFLLVRFHRVYRGPSLLFLATATGAFGLSVLIDQLPEDLLTHHYLLEDSCKLIGISNWLAFVLQAALPRLQPGPSG